MRAAEAKAEAGLRAGGVDFGEGVLGAWEGGVEDMVGVS